jgi:hypothetical protein
MVTVEREGRLNNIPNPAQRVRDPYSYEDLQDYTMKNIHHAYVTATINQNASGLIAEC